MDSKPFYTYVLDNNFKLFFIIGICGSVWAQTAVVSFFDITGKFDHVNFKGHRFWESTSNYLLFIFATGSIIAINKFVEHILLSLCFVLTVVIADTLYWYKAKQHETTPDLSDKCRTLLLRVDGVSLVAILIVFASSYFMKNNHVLSWIDENCHEQIIREFAEVFVSGAIGLHFVAITIILITFLYDWQEEFTATSLVVNQHDEARIDERKNHMGTRRILKVLVCLVLVLGGLFVYHKFSTQEPESVSIGIATWPGFAPGFVAKERGYFGALKVKIDVVDDFSARQAAFVSGKHDFTVYTIDSLAFDAGKGVKGVMVLVLDESQGADGIVANPSIRNAADLKGRIVAYTRGSPAHFLLVTYLRQAGLGISDIQTVEVDDPSRAAQAFIAGSVDAAVTWEPHLMEIKQQGKGHVIADTKSLPGVIVDVLVTSPESLVKRPHVVKTIVKGWLRAIRDIKNDDADAYTIMASGLGLKENELRDMAKGLIYADDPVNRKWFDVQLNGKSAAQSLFENAGSVWREESLSSSPELSNEYLDASYALE